MPFQYTAIDATGQRTSGTLEAGSKGEAYRMLEQARLTPIKVDVAAVAPVAGMPSSGDNSGAQGKAKSEALPSSPVPLKRAHLIHFTEELADLLDSGLQLEQALRIMVERQDQPSVKKVSALLRDEIREGASMSKALPRASPSFDELYINMVAAGEASGSLPEILRRLGHNQTIMHELQQRVVQAMIYPAFMIGACILLMVVFMTVLVPQLTSLLGKTGQELPAMTQMLVNFSGIMTSYWWLILIVLITAFLLFKAYVSKPKGRLWWDEYKMKIPLFGPVISTRFYAQFSQALANLVSNGVPLLSGLRLMGRATPNTFLKQRISDICAFVGEGGALSVGMRKASAFPGLFCDMVAVGEQTGSLSHSLKKSATRYDKELDKKIKRMTTLISPVVIIFMAVIVTVVAYSIVTAIFQSVNGIRGG